MRRSLSLNAVGQHVGDEILVKSVDRESQKAPVDVDVGQRERRDEQRIQLERAVVAFAREMLPEICDLRLKAGSDARLETRPARFEIDAVGEAAPCVHPVLDATADHVARIVVDRDLRNPRIDEPLPCDRVLAVTCLFGGCREIEAVIELAPFEPPLTIGGKHRPDPVRLGAELDRPALNWKASGDDLVGHRAAAVFVLEHAEHAARRGRGHRRFTHHAPPVQRPGEDRRRRRRAGRLRAGRRRPRGRTATTGA